MFNKYKKNHKRFLLNNLPDSTHKKLKVESAKTGKTMELLIIEAIKEKYNK